MITFLRSLTLQGKLFAGAAALLFLIAVAAGLYFSGKRKGENVVANAKQSGRVEAVATGQAQTLDQLGDANHAQQDLRSSGERSPARFQQCLLDSDRPAACERYRPLPPAKQLVPG